jgi:stage III sporulation protein AD
MEVFFRVCAIGILTALLTLVLKRSNSVLATVLAVVCSVAIGLVAIGVLKPVVEFLQELQTAANLSENLMKPLLKTVAIGILTQITSAICQDAGETAIGKMVELCGGILALYLALPLLTAVLSLLNQMTGG